MGKTHKIMLIKKKKNIQCNIYIILYTHTTQQFGIIKIFCCLTFCANHDTVPFKSLAQAIFFIFVFVKEM